MYIVLNHRDWLSFNTLYAYLIYGFYFLLISYERVNLHCGLGDKINSGNRNANVVKHTKKGTLLSGEVYAVKHTFGQVAENDSDDDDPTDPDYHAKYVSATPNTRRKLKSEHDLEKAGKLGPVATFFTLVKGFVATGVLFLPKGWRNGGWLFSSSALVMSCIFSSIC